ncbi:hypothetical protein TNCV_4215921 [Trichonephila clavipes]|nr:hypothetical protein TNCV_4215921 [Trichonephila clavipes]
MKKGAPGGLKRRFRRGSKSSAIEVKEVVGQSHLRDDLQRPATDIGLALRERGVGIRHPFRWGKRRTQEIPFLVNNNRADIKITVAIPRDRRPPINLDY